MSTRLHRFSRWSAVAALSLPLLATGTCLRVAEQSTAAGAWDAITPQLVAELSSRLNVYADLPPSPVGSLGTALQRGVADGFVSAQAAQ